MSKISIIIPAYNAENCIQNSLVSLANQSMKNIEIIIVNDGSEDNTLEVVNTIIKKYNFKNIKIINTSNRGVSAARNTGICKSVGEYIFFLDSDDFVSEDFINMLEYNMEFDFDVIAWKYDLINKEKKIVSRYDERHSKLYDKLSSIEAVEYYLEGKMRIWTCSAIYRRSFLLENDLKFSEGCKNGEDIEFIIKSLYLSTGVYFIDKTLSFYFLREGSISNKYDIRRFDVVEALIRTANFIREKSEYSKRMELAKIVDKKLLLSNYFDILESNINFLNAINNKSIYKNTKMVIKEINKN